VIITEDADFVQELTTYFQTESWLKRIDPESAKYARIIGDKRAHNAQRLTQIRERLRQLFVTSEFAVGDQEILVTGATPIDRIERAFQELVSTFYPNLRMLKENFSQESLKKILYQESGFFTQDEAQRSEPEREMLNWIMRRIAVSQSVNLANIEDEFSSGTYGWYEWAVLCVLARLFAHQEIELFRATEILGRDEVYTILNQNRAHETVSIKPAPKISARDVERLKSLHFELFHTENQGSNSKESGIKFKESLLELSNKFSEALRIAPHFTFVTQLKSEVDKLNQLLKKEWHYFLENYDEYTPDLRRTIDEVIDPAIKFLNGPNVDTWRQIDSWLTENHDNLAEMDMPSAVEAIRAYRDSPDLYRTSDTKRAKDLWIRLVEKQKSLVESEQAAAVERIRRQYARLAEVPEWNSTSEEVRENIKLRFGELESLSASAKSLGAIRDIGITKARTIYENSLSMLAEQAKELDPSADIRYATSEERKVPFAKTALLTESDVDSYATALSKAWKNSLPKERGFSCRHGKETSLL